MYRVGRFKEIYTREPLLAQQRVRGEFRLILRNPDDSVAQDTGWFHNLITNTGLVNFNGTTIWYNNIHIGSSNAAPAFTDTALGAWLATQSTPLVNTVGPTPSAPDYEFYSTRGARFNAGVGTGTVRELGLNHTGTNTAMNIRILVSPEVVKLFNQVLDVYYRFTVYPEIGDATGVVSIAGEDYDYILRPTELDNALHQVFNSFGPSANTLDHQAYSGAIGTNLTEPADLMSTPWSESVSLLTRGSGFYEYRIKWGLDDANHVNGIRCISSRNNLNQGAGKHGWQVQFTRQSDMAAVPKINTMEFYVTIRMTWARH